MSSAAVAGRLDARRVFLRNSIVTVTAQSVLVLLLIISVPYMAHRLGTSQYGGLLIIMTYLELFTVLNLGLNTALVKKLAELIPRDEMEEARAYFTLCATFFSASGILIAAATAIWARAAAATFLKLSPELIDTISGALRIASAAFLVRFVSQVLAAVPIALQRSDVASTITVATELLRVSFSMLVLMITPSVSAVVAVTLFSSLLSALAYAYTIQRLAPELLRPSRFQRRHLRDLVRFSSFVVVTNVSSRVVSSVDQFFIGYYMPVANVAFYSISYSIGQRLWSIVGSVAASVFPLASALEGAEDELRNVYLRAIRITVAMAAFPTALLIVYRSEILLLWLGPDFAYRSAAVMGVLLIAFLINSAGLVPFFVLQSTAPQVTAVVAVVYAALNCLCFAILIPLYGLMGAASAFLVSQLLTFPMLAVKANQYVGADARETLGAYAPGLVISFLAVAVTLPLRAAVHSAIALAGVFAAASVICGALCWQFLFGAADRRLLTNRFVR